MKQLPLCKSLNLVFLMLLLFCTDATAQKMIVVVDMSTKRQLQNVEVTIKNDSLPDSVAVAFSPSDIVKRTNYKGIVVMPRDYTRAYFWHPGYETLTLQKEEVGDTIALLPKFNMLSEVVVVGFRPDDYNKRFFNMNKTEMQLQQPVPQSLNLLGIPFLLLRKILPKRHKVDKKKMILENY